MFFGLGYPVPEDLLLSVFLDQQKFERTDLPILVSEVRDAGTQEF